MSRIGLYQLAESLAIDNSYASGGGNSIPFLPPAGSGSGSGSGFTAPPPAPLPSSAPVTNTGAATSTNASGQTPFIPSTLNTAAAATTTITAPAVTPWYQWFLDNPGWTVGGAAVLLWIGHEIFKRKPKKSTNG